MKATFESDGATTPEFRAAILGELLRLISIQLVVVPYDEALAHIMRVSNCKEEQLGGEVLRSWFLLERSGLIKTNDFQTVGAGTNTIPSRLITDYLWEENSGVDTEEGAA